MKLPNWVRKAVRVIKGKPKKSAEQLREKLPLMEYEEDYEPKHLWTIPWETTAERMGPPSPSLSSLVLAPELPSLPLSADPEDLAEVKTEADEPRYAVSCGRCGLNIVVGAEELDSMHNEIPCALSCIGLYEPEPVIMDLELYRLAHPLKRRHTLC